MRPCEVCGRESSYDMWKAPAHYYRQGRHGQGSKTPQWCLAEHSETLGVTLCMECFKPRFVAAAIKRRESAL